MLRDPAEWPNSLYEQDLLSALMYLVHGVLSPIFLFVAGPRLFLDAALRFERSAQANVAIDNDRESTVMLSLFDPAIALYWASLAVLIVSAVPPVVTEAVFLASSLALTTAPGPLSPPPVTITTILKAVLVLAAVSGLAAAFVAANYGDSLRERFRRRRAPRSVSSERHWKRRSNSHFPGVLSAPAVVSPGTSVQVTPFGWLSSWQERHEATDGLVVSRRSTASVRDEHDGHVPLARRLLRLVFPVLTSEHSSHTAFASGEHIFRRTCETPNIYLALHLLLGSTWAIFLVEEFPIHLRLVVSSASLSPEASYDSDSPVDLPTRSILVTPTALVAAALVAAHIAVAVELARAAYGALTIPPETQRLTLKRSNPRMSTGSAVAPPPQAVGSTSDLSVSAASPAVAAGDSLQPPTPFREARDGVSAADRCRSFAQARSAVVEAHAAATAAAAAAAAAAATSTKVLVLGSQLDSTSAADFERDDAGSDAALVRPGRWTLPVRRLNVGAVAADEEAALMDRDPGEVAAPAAAMAPAPARTGARVALWRMLGSAVLVVGFGVGGMVVGWALVCTSSCGRRVA
ncbi:hypothetical protein HK405_008039 [Cladochytrium tenue]|nr:hypothetical protein HK405_008039 [Cladochytrium tenue]